MRVVFDSAKQLAEMPSLMDDATARWPSVR
jgi:hypothetical protein